MRNLLLSCDSISEDNKFWREICVGTRIILFLSFQERNWETFLPHYFHILTCIISLCQPMIRQNLYSSLINVFRHLLNDQNNNKEVYYEIEINYRKITEKKQNCFGFMGFHNLEQDYEALATFSAHESENGIIETFQNLQRLVTILTDTVNINSPKFSNMIF